MSEHSLGCALSEAEIDLLSGVLSAREKARANGRCPKSKVWKYFFAQPVAMLQCEACAQPMCSQCVAKAKSASVCFQVVLSCSLLILCKDHRTAFSYFYEAFEAYHQTSSTAKAWLDTVDTVDTSLSFELF